MSPGNAQNWPSQHPGTRPQLVGKGHVKTLGWPLRIKEVQLADGSLRLASDGTPSDCVALAVLGYITPKIDLVVSGINPMPNLGHDVTYSGTVTAAMEVVIWGITGVAFRQL